MAVVRLAVAGCAAVALAGCAAAAQPTPAPEPVVASGIAVPVGWQALPELATAVGHAARGDGVVVEGVEAWGEPGRGCYAAWIALRGGDGGNLLVADDVVAGLAAEKIAISEVVKPAGDGVMSFGFARLPYAGKLRARLERGRVIALACFANDREPGSCAATCAALLGSLS